MKYLGYYLPQDSLSLLILCLAVVAIFFIFRALVLWYWKIDKIESHLRKIEENTRPSSAPAVSLSGLDEKKDKDEEVNLMF